MATYLLTWKEESRDDTGNGVWPEYRPAAKQTKAGRPWEGHWDTGKRVHGIMPGDRVFVMKQGDDPAGIIAAGYVIGEVESRPHFKNPEEIGNSVRVRLDDVLNYDKDDLLRVKANLPNGPWRSQTSGALIDEETAAKLETLWSAHLEARGGAAPAK